jgi:hypothetical protein
LLVVLNSQLREPNNTQTEEVRPSFIVTFKTSGGMEEILGAKATSLGFRHVVRHFLYANVGAILIEKAPGDIS